MFVPAVFALLSSSLLLLFCESTMTIFLLIIFLLGY